MADLGRAFVFLSASFPNGDRGESFRPYDASAVADAVSAFTRNILSSNGQLLFGGHPTITPLVLMVARETGTRHSVVVYQSEWFHGQIVPEVENLEHEQLGKIVWTPRAEELGASLKCMREQMILSRPCRAALFIGGMEGIFDEFDMVRKLSPTTALFPIAGPGGAAAQLSSCGWDSLGLESIHSSRAYPYAALKLVDALEGMREAGH